MAGQKCPEKIEYNVHIPFSQDTDRASGELTNTGREQSRNRSDRPLCAEFHRLLRRNTRISLHSSLSLSLSFSFYFHRSRTSNHTDRSSTSSRWISLARDPGERRCPAARIPEGDFQQSNVGIVSTVREIASLTAVFFLTLPACFRFHPRRRPIISSFSVRQGDGRATELEKTTPKLRSPGSNEPTRPARDLGEFIIEESCDFQVYYSRELRENPAGEDDSIGGSSWNRKKYGTVGN
mgnify:CR=1 FL=1